MILYHRSQDPGPGPPYLLRRFFLTLGLGLVISYRAVHFFFVFLALAGACQRNGVGGFIVPFIIITGWKKDDPDPCLCVGVTPAPHARAARHCGGR